jgi:hypothetical protein
MFTPPIRSILSPLLQVCTDVIQGEFSRSLDIGEAVMTEPKQQQQ